MASYLSQLESWHLLFSNTTLSTTSTMTSSDGNVFRLTDPKWAKWPATGGCHSQMPVTQNVDVSLIFAGTNGWANNRDAGDLMRHCVRYGVTVTSWNYIFQMVAMGQIYCDGPQHHTKPRRAVWAECVYGRLCASNWFENGNIWSTFSYSRRQNKYFRRVRFGIHLDYFEESLPGKIIWKRVAFYRLKIGNIDLHL